MEIIKKKISLEPFNSRIPTSLTTSEGNDKNGSWGKKPAYLINLFNTELRYGTLMSIYYILIDVVKNSSYFKYSIKSNKWIPIKSYDWRRVFDENNVIYNSNTESISGIDSQILGVYDSDKVSFFNNIPLFFGDKDINGFVAIKEIHKILGIFIVPEPYQCENCGEIIYSDEKNTNCYNCGSKLIVGQQEVYVPFLMYFNEINDFIKILEKYKTNHICSCDNSKFKEYGGQSFLDYLLKKKEYNYDPSYYETNNNTIDLPVLLTGKLVNIGTYKVYNVDTVYEDSENFETNDNNDIKKDESTTIYTQGESKLRTLRIRKRSFDDNNNELPFIISYNDSNELIPLLAYQINHIKNIQYLKNYDNEDAYFGDLIYKINEIKETGEIEFIYVLGGKLRLNNEGKFVLDEENPFTFTDINDWTGYGIWYKETYTYSVNTGDYTIDGITYNGIKYKVIEFDKKEITYEFDGIDFPRKKYILCTDIVYKSNSTKDMTNDPIFRDEKMLSISFPIKQQYDVAIDRGYAVAFERHLQLTEIKTWDDLEKYRNGSLLNN